MTTAEAKQLSSSGHRRSRDRRRSDSSRQTGGMRAETAADLLSHKLEAAAANQAAQGNKRPNMRDAW